MDDEHLKGLPYPGIAKACFLVALDNGGINRGRSVKRWRKDYARWIGKQDVPTISQIDTWFRSLTDEQLNDACVGGTGEPEVEAIRATAPAFMDDILNTYFEEVC